MTKWWDKENEVFERPHGTDALYRPGRAGLLWERNRHLYYVSQCIYKVSICKVPRYIRSTIQQWFWLTALCCILEVVMGLGCPLELILDWSSLRACFFTQHLLPAMPQLFLPPGWGSRTPRSCWLVPLPFFVRSNLTCHYCQLLPGVSRVPDTTRSPLSLSCAYTSTSDNNMNNAPLYECHDYSSLKIFIVVLFSDFTRFFLAETTYCLCYLSQLRL